MGSRNQVMHETPWRAGTKVAVSTVARPFRATRAAGYVGAFFAGGLALSALYATTGLGWCVRSVL